MNRPAHVPAAPAIPPTNNMTQGWHCLHLYLRANQKEWLQLADYQRAEGRDQLIQLLDPNREGAPKRIQTSVVSRHEADLGLMILDPDPLVINGIRQGIRASRFGTVLEPTYSFVSITEVSEYVPSLEQFAARLKREGTDPSDPVFQAKMTGYEQRLPMMNQQRMYPDFPPFPIACFYPMNKIRHPNANWYQLPFSERADLMAEHATSGIKFAGRVSQLITASTGFDDWEWGVTLWGRAPEHIKEIVYTMRFDRASARYAEFGPFYTSYVMSPADAMKELRL